MEESKHNEHKVLAILAIVFGAIGLAFSWVPIINNMAAIFAVVGAILGIIALVKNRKSKKTKSIVGLVLSVVAFFIVLSTQNTYSNEIDKATGTATSSKSTDKISTRTFKVGETATYKGVEYKINSVNYNSGNEYVKPDKDGNKYVVVNVTITNKDNDDKISYNPFDFKLDDNGNQTDMDSYDPDTEDTLKSGDLAKGASVTSNLIGEANSSDKLKVIYDGNMFSKKEKVTFALN
ncbi:DUF4190 domain-containing protein [Fructobacillus durionis]|uniref:DUF4352 domain-containing protein n=1 Tax=Fructobacillus durionis TaxID=283737 RepID=A0A1I1DS91_9LACO|nr:DUF4190 domain-containing protein [Fructobacillus durionis]SFB77761.1 protein of unknown function [Fructobacillus durionis]